MDQVSTPDETEERLADVARHDVDHAEHSAADDFSDDLGLMDLVRTLGDEDDPVSPSDERTTPTTPGSTEKATRHAGSDPSSKDQRASCPSGSPRPKINFSPAGGERSEANTDQAKQAVNRLFGSSTNDESKPEPSAAVAQFQAMLDGTTPAVVEAPKPPSLLERMCDALDRSTLRLEALHVLLPQLLGWLGIFLLFNSSAITVLAFLGWI